MHVGAEVDPHKLSRMRQCSGASSFNRIPIHLVAYFVLLEIENVSPPCCPLCRKSKLALAFSFALFVRSMAVFSRSAARYFSSSFDDQFDLARSLVR